MSDINKIVVHKGTTNEEYNICPKDYAAGGSIESTLNAKANIAQQGNAGDLEDGSTLMGRYNTDTGKWWTRTGLNIWNYIQGKISSVLGLTKDNYGGQAASLKDPQDATVDVAIGWRGNGVTVDNALRPCVYTNKDPNGNSLGTNKYRVKDMNWADFGTKLNTSAGVALKSEVESEAQARANADSDITKNFTEADAALQAAISALQQKVIPKHYYSTIPSASSEKWVTVNLGTNVANVGTDSKISFIFNVKNVSENKIPYVTVDFFSLTAQGAKRTLITSYTFYVPVGSTFTETGFIVTKPNSVFTASSKIGIGIFNETTATTSPLIKGGQLEIVIN